MSAQQNMSVEPLATELTNVVFQEFMRQHGEDLMLNEGYNEEIDRLTTLREEGLERKKEKVAFAKTLITILGSEFGEQIIKKKILLITNYNSCYKLTTYKILLFTALKDKNKKMWDKLYSEDKMNELIMDWAESGWEYLGEGDIEEQSKKMKIEFGFFKIINMNINSFM